MARRSLFLSAGIHVLFVSAFFFFRGQASSVIPIIIDFSLEKTPLAAQAESKPSLPKKAPVKATLRPKAVDPREAFPDTTEPDTLSLPEETAPEAPAFDSVPSYAAGAADDDSLARLKAQYVEAHYTEIRDKVYRAISYPTYAQEKEWQGEVKVSFFVHCDGRVDNITVMESSGHALLDQNAMEAVKRAAPYAPSPKKIEIRLPIKYRLE
ncbi:MAG: energy transducer TonB [Fibrobacterota bacterium]